MPDLRSTGYTNSRDTTELEDILSEEAPDNDRQASCPNTSTPAHSIIAGHTKVLTPGRGLVGVQLAIEVVQRISPRVLPPCAASVPSLPSMVTLASPAWGFGDASRRGS